MNNIKKTAFGVLVAGLAFGFSAFSTKDTGSVFTYYKTDMTYPSATDPRGYHYYSGDWCSAGGQLCTAQWALSYGFPSNDGDPLPTTGVTFMPGTVTSGHFE